MSVRLSKAMVELKEISSATVREIASLRVSKAQELYVAANALSIAEAYFEKGSGRSTRARQQ